MRRRKPRFIADLGSLDERFEDDACPAHVQPCCDARVTQPISVAGRTHSHANASYFIFPRASFIFLIHMFMANGNVVRACYALISHFWCWSPIGHQRTLLSTTLSGYEWGDCFSFRFCWVQTSLESPLYTICTLHFTVAGPVMAQSRHAKDVASGMGRVGPMVEACLTGLRVLLASNKPQYRTYIKTEYGDFIDLCTRRCPW